MPQINVNRVTNANVYINGVSQLGKAEEIDLPKVTMKMVEHKALGMIGSFELPAGLEKMEVRIKWNAVYGDVISNMANPYKAIDFSCRSSVENWSASGRDAESPMKCIFRGTFKEVPTGNFKQHDNVEMESRVAVTYLRLDYNGLPKIEIDVLANIWKVDGVDILANYKANIGG